MYQYYFSATGSQYFFNRRFKKKLYRLRKFPIKTNIYYPRAKTYTYTYKLVKAPWAPESGTVGANVPIMFLTLLTTPVSTNNFSKKIFNCLNAI